MIGGEGGEHPLQVSQNKCTINIIIQQRLDFYYYLRRRTPFFLLLLVMQQLAPTTPSERGRVREREDGQTGWLDCQRDGHLSSSTFCDLIDLIKFASTREFLSFSDFHQPTNMVSGAKVHEDLLSCLWPQ